MAFLLVTILVVSLAITFIGFLLSSKPSIRGERMVYRVPSYLERNGRRLHEPLRSRRIVKYTEQRSWADGLQFTQVVRLFGRREGEPTSWTGTVLVLVAIFLLSFYILRSVLPNVVLIGAAAWPYNNHTAPQNTAQGSFHATQVVVRIDQLDPAQYNNQQEYDTWSLSTCSAAAMTEVINAYKHHYRLTDILKVEVQLGEITPQLGLLEDMGIQRTADRFGFQTTYMHNASLDDVLKVANSGKPVIVSFPPDRYPHGHIVVVTGGNGNDVYLADSSIFDRHSLTRAAFLNLWEGFAAVVTPK